MTQRPILKGSMLVTAVVAGCILVVLGYVVREQVLAVMSRLDAATPGGGAALSVEKSNETVGIWGRLVLNLLYAGPIPYSILLTFLVCAVYAGILFVRRSVPGSRKVAAELAEVGGNDEAECTWDDMVAAADELPAHSVVRRRVAVLANAHAASHSAEVSRGENDRAAAEAESDVHYQLLPLVYGEWMLPVLGFIGTVWGVILAVTDLRLGIIALFRDKVLTEEVLASFNRGFDGLGISFFTTLFGLVGLAIVGTANTYMRRGAVRALTDLDAFCRRALLKLRDEDLLELLRSGLFVTDEQHRLVAGEDGKPQLRMSQWLEDLHRGLFQADSKGKLERDKEGAPIPRSERWQATLRRGLFVSNEAGELVSGDDGQPVPRWQAFFDLLQSELFAAGPNGEPVSKWAHWRSTVLLILVREFLEVTNDEAMRIADGTAMGPEGEREVMLGSRAERRFRQLVAELRVLELLLAQQERLQAGGHDDGRRGPEVPPLGHKLLASTGCPVLSAAVERGGLVLGREAGVATSEFALYTGTVQEMAQGKFQVPIMDPTDIPAPEAPQGLALGDDTIVCAFDISKTVHVVARTPGIPPKSVSFETGEVLGRSLVLMPRQEVPHAVIVVGDGKSYEVRAWPIDGQVPPGQWEVLGKVAGSEATLACWNDRGLAIAAREGQKTTLVVFRPGQAPVTHSLAMTLRAMAFTPTGSLWLVGADSTLAEFDVRMHTPAPKARGRLGVAADALRATEADEVVFAQLGQRDLYFAQPGRLDAAVRVRYDSEVTCLTSSADGRCAVVGLADGSAYFHDTRHSLAGS